MELNDIKRYIDIEDAIKRMMGNKNLYKKLLRSFLDNGYADTLRGDMERGDTEAATVTAHTVKGLCANLSLTELYGVTIELEAALKNGGSTEAPYERFNAVLDETVKGINAVLEDS